MSLHIDRIRAYWSQCILSSLLLHVIADLHELRVVSLQIGRQEVEVFNLQHHPQGRMRSIHIANQVSVLPATVRGIAIGMTLSCKAQAVLVDIH